MKAYAKTALVLCLICACAALVLSLANALTAPRIKDYEDGVLKSALEAVSGGKAVGDYVPVEDNPVVSGYYPILPSGYILSLRANGYGGEITLLAAYDAKGVLTAAKLVSDSETPGLGKRAEESWYMDKFIGKGTDMPVRKNMLSASDAEAVSGASVTFTGVSRALLAGSMFVSMKEAN
ncbi:MAG: FMN-binding protein [Spirochaetales bacterium]|nr:FMN-binding protein [Spirochaetales bacterium]